MVKMKTDVKKIHCKRCDYEWLPRIPDVRRCPIVNPIILIEHGRIKEIPLTQGKVALVDVEDYGWLSRYKWCAHLCVNTFYAVRTIKQNGKNFTSPMHREILSLKPYDNKIVDHKNRNGLDNRKENLRVTNYSINGWNSKLSKKNTSGYRGVSWSQRDKIWRCQMQINGKMTNCGSFNTAKEAAIEYDRISLITRGDNANLNFSRINLSPV